MQTQTQTDQVPAIVPVPEQHSQILTIKIRLQGRDKHRFLALQDLYEVSDKQLAAAAVRHFLDAAKHQLPRLETL
jgi:hypothetical protein